MSFDLEDYKIRQFRIWAIIFGAWTITIISGLVARYSDITDKNTVEVIVFLALTAAIVFVIGLYTSFMAWAEKKLFQYEEKIDDDAG